MITRIRTYIHRGAKYNTAAAEETMLLEVRCRTFQTFFYSSIPFTSKIFALLSSLLPTLVNQIRDHTAGAPAFFFGLRVLPQRVDKSRFQELFYI